MVYWISIMLVVVIRFFWITEKELKYREVLSPGREFRHSTADNKTILCFKQESYSMKIVLKIFFWKWFFEMIRIKNGVRVLIKSH